MDRDSVAKMFWQRLGMRQYELNMTAKRIQEETEKITGKPYRLTESKCRNALPDTYTICVLATILRTTTDYLLGFVDNAGDVSTQEIRIVEKYRQSKSFRGVIDNLMELL